MRAISRPIRGAKELGERRDVGPIAVTRGESVVRKTFGK